MTVKDLIFRWVGLGIGCFYSLLVLFSWAVAFVKSPLTYFSWKKRNEQPSCLSAPDLGTHGFIHLEDVRIHYVAAGDENKPLMLFVHGFPEFWYSWRHQIREFKKDYRVVAIDMRGYGDSDKPSGVENYKTIKMVNDIKQLVPALGHSSCVLVAHDWGGAIAWAVAALYPDIVDKLIIMNAPHPTTFRKYIETHFSQFKKSWYIMFFQVPYIPEITFSVKDYKALEQVYRSKPSGLASGTLTEEDLEAYKYAFSRPGAKTCAINYYRAALRYPTSSRLPVITSPTLVIWGEKDTALEKEMVPDIGGVVKQITIKYIPEASHWVQMDTPTRVNELMRDFLK